MESASGYLVEQFTKQQSIPPRIVLTVIESLSWEINNLQLASLEHSELGDKCHVMKGPLPFKGLRELCQVDVSAVVSDVSLLPVDKCLPKYLGQADYKTVAIHGFSGHFFNRKDWYPKLEFEDVYFMPGIDEKLNNKERCGSTFRGNCDHLVLDFIEGNLANDSSPRLFLYWLTLN